MSLLKFHLEITNWIRVGFWFDGDPTKFDYNFKSDDIGIPLKVPFEFHFKASNGI